MEYEQHCGGKAQSVVSRPKIPGLKSTEAKILQELKTGLVLLLSISNFNNNSNIWPSAAYITHSTIHLIINK